LKEHIRSIVHSMFVKHALAGAAALALCALFVVFSARPGSGSVGADPAFEAKKAEIFKKFNVQVAKPGEFPITIFPADKVPPVMHGVGMVGDIVWQDNDTIMYVPQSDIPPARLREKAGLLSLVSVNLKTFERKEIDKVSGQYVCYDYETHNIRYVGAIGEGDNKQRAVFYGKLGEALKTDFQVRFQGEKQPQNWDHTIDCTYYPVLPPPGDTGRSAIRVSDGYLVLDQQNGKDLPGHFVLTKPDGTVKRFTLGTSNLDVFRYDNFSHLYWHYEDTHWNKDKIADGIDVWRLTRDMDVVSKEFYRHGPWAYGYPLTHSTKPGFIFGGHTWVDNAVPRRRPISHEFLFLAKPDGSIIEIAEDILGEKIVVSPNGCKVIGSARRPSDEGASKQTGQFIQINLCKQ
jgi:hypothetical protein